MTLPGSWLEVGSGDPLGGGIPGAELAGKINGFCAGPRLESEQHFKYPVCEPRAFQPAHGLEDRCRDRHLGLFPCAKDGQSDVVREVQFRKNRQPVFNPTERQAVDGSDFVAGFQPGNAGLPARTNRIWG
jgi:hypothetical protein